MAWMSDEAWEFTQDSIEKKSTARSARHARTHCGKSGAVKFPSDYLGKKELRKMNGECVKYASLKKPMTWAEFKQLPDDLKVTYIKRLREQFNVPDAEIAKMFDVGATGTLWRWFRTLGLNKGVGSGGKAKTWNKEGWLAWLHGVDPEAVEPSETPVPEEVPVEENDISATEEIEVVYTPIDEQVSKEEADRLYECAMQATAKMFQGSYDEMMTKKLKTRPVPEKQATDDVQHYVDNFFRNEAIKEGYLATDDATEGSTCCCEKKRAIPNSGEMSFNGKIEDILNTIGLLLDGAKVCLEVKWMTAED